jgi:ferredoxin
MANLKEYARTKEGSNIGKIVVDRDLCIAASSCVAIASETFELDAESKVIVKDSNIIDDDTLIMSVEACPTKAIFLFDKSGVQIFPK